MCMYVFYLYFSLCIGCILQYLTKKYVDTCFFNIPTTFQIDFAFAVVITSILLERFFSVSFSGMSVGICPRPRVRSDSNVVNRGAVHCRQHSSSSPRCSVRLESVKEHSSSSAITLLNHAFMELALCTGELSYRFSSLWSSVRKL